MTTKADRWRTRVIGALAVAALLYLFLPIFVMALFSFNDPNGRFNVSWEGFTFEHWLNPFDSPGIGTAVRNSLLIAAISTSVALVLGTFMALALVRHGFRGRGAVDLFVFLPLTTPEVVLGASLLGLFLTVGFSPGFVTILIAHIMFSVSYVVVTIKARLEGMDTHIEEAAMDLGANEWTTFTKVTLPMIRPGIAAAGLLTFALSFDDFVITNFTAGQTSTFPLLVYGTARQGVPPQVNVMATALLLIVLVFMVINIRVQSRRAARENAGPPTSASAALPV